MRARADVRCATCASIRARDTTRDAAMRRATTRSATTSEANHRRSVRVTATLRRSFESEIAPLRAAGIEVHHLGSRVLAQGDCCPEVSALQAMLNGEKLLQFGPTGLPSGLFDSATTEALKKWQRMRGMEPTGVFGESAREVYLAQKKSKLFSSIFGPQPPTRDWITASEFGKPVRDKGQSGWSKEAYLSSMDVFVASFLSGILFTSAVVLQYKVQKRTEELRQAGDYAHSRLQITGEVLSDFFSAVVRTFVGVLAVIRDRLPRLPFLGVRDDEARLSRRSDFGFALRVGNWRVGVWE